MNTFNIKQAAIKNVEKLTGNTFDPTYKIDALMVKSFMSGVDFANGEDVETVNTEAEYVANLVCNMYEVTFEQIQSAKRTREIVEARRMMIYILNNTKCLRKLQIARFVNKDHSSITYALNTQQHHIDNNVLTRYRYERILKILKNSDGDN